VINRLRAIFDAAGAGDQSESRCSAGTSLRDGTTINLPDSLVRTLPIHDTSISIQARMGGREQWLVLTGTSNSTCGGLLYNDEAMMRFGRRWAYHQYAAHFAYPFARAHQSTHPLEVPTQKHCA
jgi:hypothetical protein